MFRALRRRASFSGGTVVDIRSISMAPTRRSIAAKMVQHTTEIVEETVDFVLAWTAEGGRRHMFLSQSPMPTYWIRGSAIRGLKTEVRGPISASHAYVLESQRSQARRVEQVLGIDDDGLLQQVLDAVEVEGTEFRPAGADDQSV